jgi:hypothetical protein
VSKTDSIDTLESIFWKSVSAKKIDYGWPEIKAAITQLLLDERIAELKIIKDIPGKELYILDRIKELEAKKDSE